MKLIDITIEKMCTTTDKQSFDRKSTKNRCNNDCSPHDGICKCGW